MTYRSMHDSGLIIERAWVFEVSRVRPDAGNKVQQVSWYEVGTVSGYCLGSGEDALSVKVINSIHDGATVLTVFNISELGLHKRRCVIVSHEEGGKRFVLNGPAAQCLNRVNRGDLQPIETGFETAETTSSSPIHRTVLPIHAVFKLRLDADGWLTASQGETVDSTSDDWITPEAIAPVGGTTTDASLAGHQFSELFLSSHGHLLSRQLVADDDDSTRTHIVLDGLVTQSDEVCRMGCLIEAL